MAEEDSLLHFAQYVHMVRTGMLDDLLPDHDWHAMAAQIHDLRAAFDTTHGGGASTHEGLSKWLAGMLAIGV